MIDLDRLDEGLAQAMTAELRALRGMTAGWASPARETRTEPAPARPPEPPVEADDSWDDDLWAEAGFEPPAPDDPYVRLKPRPEPAPQPAPPKAKPAAPTPAATPPQFKRVDVTFEKRPRAAMAPPAPTAKVTADTTPRPPKPPKVRPIVVEVPAPTASAQASPATSAAPTPPNEDRVGALMAQGRVAEADAEIAKAGTPMEWRIMRALFDGRRDEASASLRLVTKLGKGDRFWFQRYWVALEWGERAEQYQVLDHCREQAYRHGEPQWWGALTLELARLGRQEEAARELAATMGGLDSWPDDGNRLDIVTNLIEAAYLLGDARAAETLAKRLQAAKARTPLVVVGPAWICKGALVRYEALAAAATGQWKLADERFSAAAETHEDAGAQPLLARTLIEWGHAVLAHDHSRGSRYIDCGVGIADKLHLTGLANLTRRSSAMAS